MDFPVSLARCNGLVSTVPNRSLVLLETSAFALLSSGEYHFLGLFYYIMDWR